MNAHVLRAGAALVAFTTFVAATEYVVAHPKNPTAPLQPPVEAVAAPSPTPSPARSAAPTASQRGSVRPTASPPPKITLQPGVRATELPGITYTHTS